MDVAKNYQFVFTQLVEQISDSSKKVIRIANETSLHTYWVIGRTIVEQKEKYKQCFALVWPNFPFPQPLVAEIQLIYNQVNDFLQPLLLQMIC